MPRETIIVENSYLSEPDWICPISAENDISSTVIWQNLHESLSKKIQLFKIYATKGKYRWAEQFILCINNAIKDDAEFFYVIWNPLDYSLVTKSNNYT